MMSVRGLPGRSFGPAVWLSMMLIGGASLAALTNDSNLAGAEQASSSMVVRMQDCVVRFADEVQVPALESGRVAKIEVKLNDQVQSATPLARLDDRTLLYRRRQALTRLNSSKSDANEEV
ncbi:MAG: biotin/lipoyl-binding protein, partial [Pirellulales bacterium]|nr:biotin/lipoyl-binding protein [Pirellulales bacterium]